MKTVFIAIFLCVLTVSGSAEEAVSPPEIHIQRHQRAVHLNPRSDPYPRRWINRGEGLFEANFRLPADLSQIANGEEHSKRGDIKEILVRSGIVFGNGSSAKLDDKAGQLTLILPKEEMEKVEMLLGVGGCILGMIDRSVAVRVEIYELPLTRVSELQESAFPEGEHSAERSAALEYVTKYKGRCVARPSVVCRSGRRGVVKNVVEMSVPAETSKNAENPQEITCLTDIKEVGTILEVDATPAADSETIILDLELQHDTAPPTLEPVTNEQKLPAFHRESVRTQVQLESGQYLLIACWGPSKIEEDASKEIGHVAFVTANLEIAGDYGQKEKIDREPIEKR